MGVMRGQRRISHSSLQNFNGVLASGQDVGKGMYIGGNDIPPTYHHHRPHHHTSSVDSATATSPPSLGQWKSRNVDTAKNGAMSSNTDMNVDEDAFERGNGADYIRGQHSQPNRFADALPSTPSSSSPSSFYSNNNIQSGESPYVDSQAPPFVHSGPAHLRHNTTAQNSAHSSIHREANDHSFASSPLSRMFSKTNLLNLGVDHGSTLNPLHGHPNIDPIDPLPTTLELPWNLTDTLCFNKTPGNYDCWDLFNPDENDTTTHSSLIIDDEYRYWTLVLIIIPLLTVFGNILVVMSVIKEKTLKTVTNYFICSLAVADIFVAVVVMAFAVYMEVRNMFVVFLR